MTNIIIPVKNRHELLEQTIESLFKNTPHEKFNLFVYADGPDKETENTLTKLLQKHKFVLLANNVSQGPGWCRNTLCRIIGPSYDRGQFLYHSDADVYFLEGWLDALLKAYDAFPEIKLFGAGCHPYLQPKETLEKDGLVVKTRDAIPGYTAFMDWDTWNKYGPYDEHKGIMGSEDWKFCQDIIKDGYKVAAIEPELVIHCGKTNTDGNPATGHEHMVAKEGIKIL